VIEDPTPVEVEEGPAGREREDRRPDWAQRYGIPARFARFIPLPLTEAMDHEAEIRERLEAVLERLDQLGRRPSHDGRAMRETDRADGSALAEARALDRKAVREAAAWGAGAEVVPDAHVQAAVSEAAGLTAVWVELREQHGLAAEAVRRAAAARRAPMEGHFFAMWDRQLSRISEAERMLREAQRGGAGPLGMIAWLRDLIEGHPRAYRPVHPRERPIPPVLEPDWLPPGDPARVRAERRQAQEKREREAELAAGGGFRRAAADPTVKGSRAWHLAQLGASEGDLLLGSTRMKEAREAGLTE
jgi:hypothetical protein